MRYTSRTEFIGGHVTPRVKKALQARAAHQRQSVSETIYRIMLKVLKVKDDDKDEG